MSRVLLLLLLIPIDISAQNSVEVKLEQERLLALPTLKQKLSDPNLRDRADMIVVLEDSFFNKLLVEATGTKFNAGSFFTVTLENPLADFRNGLALIKLQAIVAPTNPLLTLNSRLKVVARLLVEQGKENAVVAKMEVVDIQPDGEQPAGAPAFSAEQLTSFLPPLSLPLDFNFDQKIVFPTIKQSKPVGFEITPEPRQVKGRFEIVDLLPLDKRIVLIARARNLSVK